MLSPEACLVKLGKAREDLPMDGNECLDFPKRVDELEPEGDGEDVVVFVVLYPFFSSHSARSFVAVLLILLAASRALR